MNNIFNIFTGFKYIVKNIDNYDDFLSIRNFIIPLSKNKIEKELIMSIPFENNKSMNNKLFIETIKNIINKTNIKKNYKDIINITTDNTQLTLLNYVIKNIENNENIDHLKIFE